MRGFALPEVSLGGLGGTLNLGEGAGAVSLRRTGDQIAGTVTWTSDRLTWNRPASAAAATTAPPLGSEAWGRDLVWRTLNGMERVEVTLNLEGAITAPSLGISSNVGQAVAESFRRELGQEIDAAEQRLRTEVDGLIQPVVSDARARIAEVTEGVGARIGTQRAEIDELRARLEARLQSLVGSPD